MDYITRFHIINFRKDKWFILGEVQEYIDHISIGDDLTCSIEVRKQGIDTPADYPIISGRVDHISKAVEHGFGTGKMQLVTAIGLYIDFDTVQHIKDTIERLQQKEKELNTKKND